MAHRPENLKRVQIDGRLENRTKSGTTINVKIYILSNPKQLPMTIKYDYQYKNKPISQHCFEYAPYKKRLYYQMSFD